MNESYNREIVQENSIDVRVADRTYLYNQIPSQIIRGKILELGAGNQLYQLKSVHHEDFIKSDYIGIDLDPPPNSPINIIKGDIKEANFSPESFDTIITIEVIEHISILEWAELFKKLKTWLKPNGYLFITIPYKEEAVLPSSDCPHQVFGITKNTVKNILPTATTWTIRSPHLFGGPESKIWRYLRGIKRIITFHKYTHTYLAIFFDNQKNQKNQKNASSNSI